MKQIRFKLKKIREIFPSEYTKVSAHDLIRLSKEKFKQIPLRDQEKLINIAGNLKKYYGEKDFIAKRNKEFMRLIDLE